MYVSRKMHTKLSFPIKMLFIITIGMANGCLLLLGNRQGKIAS